MSDTSLPDNEHSLKVLSILSSAGATFTKLHKWDAFYTSEDGKRVDLGKAPKGKGWQHQPYPLAELQAHLRTGENGGMHGGTTSAGIVWLDVDDGRFGDFLASHPVFQNDPIISHRDNAPGKGKVAVRIVGTVPKAKKFKHPGERAPFFELLSTGNQAAIVGTHPSGAPYRLTGSNLVTLTRADFDRIVEAWTGQTLESPQANTERPQKRAHAPRPQDDLIEQVKAHWTPYSVFERFGYAGEVCKERVGEYRLLGNGGLLVGDPMGGYAWRWAIPGDKVGGDQIDAWHYCHHGSVLPRGDKKAFVETLHEMAAAAGIEIPAPVARLDPEAVRAEIESMRNWALSTSFADIVPAELQCAAGYRTDSTDHKVYDALLDICHEYGRFTIYPNWRNIAERAGVGDHKTAKKAVQRLRALVTIKDNGWLDVARRFPTSSFGSALLVGNLRATYSTGKADDPFLSGVSRTMKRNASEIVEAGQCTVYDVPAQGDTKLKQQLRAMEAGLGESVLRVIDAIKLHGAMTRADLVKVTGKTLSAIAGATLRAEKLGILAGEQKHRRAPKTYTLLPGWRDSIELLRPHLKTFKLGAERKKRNCEAIIAYCDHQLKRCAEEERLQIQKRREKERAKLRLLLPDLLGLAPLEIEEWVNTPSATNAAFEYAPILDEERTKRAENALQTLSDLLTPGRLLLYPHELAKVRQAAGSLGMQYTDIVSSVDMAWGAT